jgi:hypothetical protein
VGRDVVERAVGVTGLLDCAQARGGRPGARDGDAQLAAGARGAGVPLTGLELGLVAATALLLLALGAALRRLASA